jgi:ElaA protein
MSLSWSVKHFSELSNTELYKIIQLRLAVFSVEQNCPYQDADDKDQEAYHLVAKNLSGELVAYARILPPGISYKEVSIGRVISSASVRGTGIGKELMQKSFDFVFEKYGRVPIRISAQCYLIRFYTELGFKVVGEEYIEDHIPHIEMVMG